MSLLDKVMERQWPVTVIGCTQLQSGTVLGYVQSERLMSHQIVSAVFVNYRRCHFRSLHHDVSVVEL
jgi:hypothetical protein